ncbi:hypothetical protein [Devosia sp. A369]
MHISFSPQHRDDTLAITKSGDALTINGEAFDFSVLSEGDDLPEAAFIGTDFIEGPVTRISGQVLITVRLPYQRDGRVESPGPLINPPDGLLVLPNLNEETINAD